MYFDNNATAPVDPRVAQAISDAVTGLLANPSSPHTYGQHARAILSASRRCIASFLKVKQSEIIFTSGGSEGAALAIRGLIRDPAHAEIISSEIEHPCVYETLECLKKEGAKITYIPVGLSGAVDPEEVMKAITPKTTALVFMAVNNETGVKQDIHAFSEIAARAKIPLIVDGVSYLGKDHVIIPKGVSAMFFSGHKIHAPQGIGFLYLKSGTKLTPQILGGHQEFGLRGGTENMLGIIGLSKAIQILEEEGANAILHMRKLRERFEHVLLEIPGIEVNGIGERVSNTVNLSFGAIDGENLLIALDQQHIAASLGSACSSGAIEPSRVLLKMGIPLKRARTSLRFSFSRFNTIEEVERAIEIIKSLF